MKTFHWVINEDAKSTTSIYLARSSSTTKIKSALKKKGNASETVLVVS